MTPAQATALQHHCRLSIETMHPRFRHQRPLATSVVLTSVVLTVNSGYE